MTAPVSPAADRTDRILADDPLLKWTERIADGQAVDWAQVEAELDPALICGLRQIAALAGGFGAVNTEPAPPQSDTLPPGSAFGPLEIVDLLGRGAYGAVYRARDPQLDREVALKVLGHPTLTRAELLREGQLMARIDHPNVLKVFGAVEDSGQVGFACELMPGESMEEWLARQGTLGAHELVAVGSELCAALCALHRGNILHGDLKPANVLRHADGRWVVADFGSSQYAQDAYGSSGTPLYMAPERFRHQLPTAASDQYSLGVLLFRLATRRYPFEAETARELENKHNAVERARLLDLRPDLPRQLIAAIERALAVEPARRHASIGELAQALAESAHARPRRVRRVQAWAIAAALTLTLCAWVMVQRGADPGADAVWLRAGNSGDEVLQPGTEVRLGDALALELQLGQISHVYVINEDSHGERFQLFPLAESDLTNPLPAGRTRLPGTAAGEPVDWRITSRGGRERFYVLIADEPLADLQQLAFNQATLAQGSDPAMLVASDPSRGVGGLAPRPKADSGPDAEWLAGLRKRYPAVTIQRFELANP
ncbi:MAG TPA: serine/threonine-protein kinase [Xanthomonadales bacterium]|nr:serine/threonine-protein kinase [Xanthomonadales bacterium]